ncbi:MAG: EcsC family protein [Bacteroidota bacterium]
MKALERYSLYEIEQLRKLKAWQKKMQQSPGIIDKLGSRVQKKINSYIPEKIHDALTAVIKKMIEAVLFTSEFVKPAVVTNKSMQEIEQSVETRMEYYRSTAAVEGGVTGFAGILGSVADFPLLLAIKIKFMFDVAAMYGYDTSNLKERVFLLYVFQLAFSNPVKRASVYERLAHWSQYSQQIPDDLNSMDWRDFQQQYRDYLDIAKLAQMLPGIGAAVGVVVNYRLLNQLHKTAIMCYRMRRFGELDKELSERN